MVSWADLLPVLAGAGLGILWAFFTRPTNAVWLRWVAAVIAVVLVWLATVTWSPLFGVGFAPVAGGFSAMVWKTSRR